MCKDEPAPTRVAVALDTACDHINANVPAVLLVVIMPSSIVKA